MPDEFCSVTYRDLDHAVSNCLKLLKQVGHKHKLYYSKTDVRLAFRLVPLLPSQYRWLVLKAQDPVTGEMFYFVDKCLPFGVSISCAIFQAFLDALAHIMKVWMSEERKNPDCLTNYLDDFLFLAYTKLLCDQLVHRFLQLCKLVGCPIAKEKTKWGMMRIIFLGILLDGEQYTLAIPEDKRRKAINLINYTLSRKTVTVKELQCLTGTLNFLCRVIFAGRTFLRRLYDKTITKEGFQLKQFHHIRVDCEMKKDCSMWLFFLQNGSNSVLYRPFVDLNVFQSSLTLNFYTDSSANGELGFGCIFGKRWMFAQWEPGFVEKNKPSIEYLELAALCIAVLTWGHMLQNTSVAIFCDNQAVVHMVNKNSSKCPNCMILIQELVLDGLLHNRRVFVKYVTSRDNEISDSLSRLKIHKFRQIAPWMNEEPDVPASRLWPLSKIWQTQ